ncbi:MAG: GntR family transcriptional regulator [Pseudomonadota bacterium]
MPATPPSKPAARRRAATLPEAGPGLGDGPLYLGLQRSLARSLAERRWPPGSALPSETRLAAEHRVSIGTVRKAIDALVAGGMLVRRQGRGTFVASHTPDRLLFHFFHVVARDAPAASPRELPSTRLLSFRHARAGAGVAEALAIAPAARVLRVENLLHLQGRAVLFDEITVAAARFPRLDRARLERREGTIYGLYESDYGIDVVRSTERLSAVACPARIARLLGLAPGDPVLRIRRVAYGWGDRPVEHRVSWVDTRTHEYLSDLWKRGPDPRG